MSASQKTILMQCFTLLSLTIIPIIFCSVANSLVNAVIFMGAYLLVNLILCSLPVSCNTGLCTGRMRQTVSRLSFWKERVHYQCDTCGDVYVADIIYPDITVEVSN